MIDLTQNDDNQAAYMRLRDAIARDYPRGHLVAIFGGKIVGDADHFETLRKLLQNQNIDPTQALMVEAGVEYPEYVTIFACYKRFASNCAG